MPGKVQRQVQSVLHLDERRRGMDDKRTNAGTHLVGDHTQRPPVHCEAITRCASAVQEQEEKPEARNEVYGLNIAAGKL